MVTGGKRTDPNGNAVHVISVADVAATTPADNPVDAKTLREITTKYDSRNRPIARTVWLVARGAVADLSNPPIAGDAGVPAGGPG